MVLQIWYSSLHAYYWSILDTGNAAYHSSDHPERDGDRCAVPNGESEAQSARIQNDEVSCLGDCIKVEHQNKYPNSSNHEYPFRAGASQCDPVQGYSSTAARHAVPSFVPFVEDSQSDSLSIFPSHHTVTPSQPQMCLLLISNLLFHSKRVARTVSDVHQYQNARRVAASSAFYLYYLLYAIRRADNK